MFRESKVGSIICRFALFLWAVAIIYPFLWILLQSLKTNVEYFQSTWKLPAVPQFVNYIKAWKELGIGRSMVNTAFTVGMSMILGTFISTLNTFVLTRLQWKGKKLVWGLVMLSLFFPGINEIIPQFILMRSLHLTNSLIGLVLLYSLGLSAFDLMVLGGFMQTIPKELEECAFIDGASIFRVFSSIVIPLSVPGIVTIAIFKFIGLYNDFLAPFLFLGDENKFTIGVNMYHANMLMQYKSDWTTLFAGVIISILPSLIVYVICQKQIVEGATLGAIKG